MAVNGTEASQMSFLQGADADGPAPIKGRVPLMAGEFVPCWNRLAKTEADLGVY